MVGACNVVWQQQQRPDKSGKSDRNHRPAKGVYMWWTHCNKLVLTYLESLGGSGGGADLKLPPISKPSTPTPPPAAPQGKPGAKGGKAAAGGAVPSNSAAQGDAAGGAGEPGGATTAADGGVKMMPSKGWLLPMGISHSCCSENGKMLAFGLSDGSALVWDDHFGGHTRILPRMPAPVTALAFVNGAPNLLFVTALDGSVYLADLNKPEDSHLSKTKLPHAAYEVCVCVALRGVPSDGLRQHAGMSPAFITRRSSSCPTTRLRSACATGTPTSSRASCGSTCRTRSWQRS